MVLQLESVDMKLQQRPAAGNVLLKLKMQRLTVTGKWISRPISFTWILQLHHVRWSESQSVSHNPCDYNSAS